MNIVSNNCLGGHMYNIYGTEFENPFIWSAISPEHMIKLINNFYDINFCGIKFDMCTRYQTNIMLLNNSIHIKYIHYIPDDKYAQIERIGHDVYGPFRLIYQYAFDNYVRRLHRMIDAAEEPLFCLHLNNPKWLLLLEQITTKCKVILVAPVQYSNKLNDYIKTRNNVWLHVPDKWNMNPKFVAESTCNFVDENCLNT